MGQRSSGDTQRRHEGYSIGVAPGVGGGVEHERADGVVAAQVPPDLLLHQRGGFRAQHRPGAALMGLEFVEDALDFPALGVGGGVGRVLGGQGGRDGAGDVRLLPRDALGDAAERNPLAPDSL